MFKSSLSLRMVLHKKMKRLTFLPSHGNLLPETEQGKPKKVPKFQSGGFFFFSAGGRESFLGTRSHFVSTSLWLPRFMFGCVLTFSSVCLSVCMCVWFYLCG